MAFTLQMAYNEDQGWWSEADWEGVRPVECPAAGHRPWTSTLPACPATPGLCRESAEDQAWFDKHPDEDGLDRPPAAARALRHFLMTGHPATPTRLYRVEERWHSTNRMWVE
jgi:hypothetical protein